MTLTQYTTYFETMATRLLPIGHTPGAPRFARVNVEELFSQLRTTLDMQSGPVLLLENYDGQISRNDADQSFIDRRCAFLIVRACLLNDFAAEQAAVEEGEALGMEILSKMNEHYQLRSELADYSPMSANWSYQRVSGILNNAHGFRFEFTITEGVALVPTPALWLD